MAHLTIAEARGLAERTMKTIGHTAEEGDPRRRTGEQTQIAMTFRVRVLDHLVLR